MLRLALTVAAVLALSAPAGAAIWSPATPPYSCPADFGFTQAGLGFAVMGYQAGVGQSEEPPMVSGYWAPLDASTVYGDGGKLALEPTDLALFGSDRFAAVGYAGPGGTLEQPLAEYATLGSVRTGPATVRRLGSARYRFPVSLGITASAGGNVVVLFGGRRAGASELRVATGSRLDHTKLIARGRSVGPGALAGNARGDVVIAWRDGSSIYARMRTPRGKLLPVQRLGSTRGQAAIGVAVAAGGQTLVAWAARGVKAAFARNGRTFSRARVLDNTFSSVRVAFTGDRGLIAWTGMAGGHAVVRAEVLGLDGRTLARPLLSPPDTVSHMTDVATDGSGIAAVAWTTAGPDLAPYMSLLIPNANAFAPPERIGDRNASDEARLAIDPVSGAIVAAGPSSPVGCWFSWRMP